MPLYVGADFMFVIEIMPVSHLDISLTNCYFELGLVGPDFWGSDENSSIYLAHNVMKDNMLAGAFLGYCMGSNCIVENNQFQNTAIFADLYITFETQDGGIAIQSLNNMDAKIWNNKFVGTGAVGVMVEGDEATGTYAENIKR